MGCENHVPKWTLALLEAAQVEANPEIGYILNVSGAKLRDGECCEEPRLHPRDEYLIQPEYCEIMVEWDAADAILESEVPFKLSIGLAEFLGTKGVEVVGRNKSVRIDVH